MSQAIAQTGNPFIQNYSPADYRSESYASSPQNRAITQDQQGLLYVANVSGILQYDGVKWAMIKGTEGFSDTQRLAVDRTGKVYFGGSGYLGFLQPDSTGNTVFVSLLPFLEKQYHDFIIDRVEINSRNVYFISRAHIFCWNGERFTVWKSSSRFIYSYAVRGKLFVHERERGLLMIGKDSLEAIPHGQLFNTLYYIQSIIALDEQRELVITKKDGLYLHQEASMIRLPDDPALPLSQTEIFHAIRLTKHEIALATTTYGIVVIDEQARIRKVINRKFGLQSEAVWFLHQDHEGGLWAALNKGVSRIEYPSPLSSLNEENELTDNPNKILKQGNRLYVGTATGLLVADKEEWGTPLLFQKFPSLTDCWGLALYQEEILAATTSGVYAIKNEQAALITPSQEKLVCYAVLPCKKDSRYVFVGLDNGVGLLKKEKNAWIWEGRLPGIEHSVATMAEMNDGRLWVSDAVVSQIDFSKGIRLDAPVKTLEAKHGLDDRMTFLEAYAINDKPYFGTYQGLFFYNDDLDRLQPETAFGRNFSNGTRQVTSLVQDNQKNIWFSSEFRTGKLVNTPGNQYTWDTIPLNRMPRTDIWTIYPDDEGIIWLGTTDGVFRYNPSVKKNYQTIFRTLIRKVTINGDSAIFNGAFPGPNHTIVNRQPAAFTFSLPYVNNDLTFDFAATSYDAPDKLMYRYLLEGHDERPSPWSSETRKGYTGLREGNYKFRVWSRNVYGTQGLEAAYEFKILPPWYRTWWAYLLYCISFVGLVWLVVKLNSRRLLDAKERLEVIVRQRTQELMVEKQKGDNLLLNILPAEVAAELKENGKALARNYKLATVLFTDFVDFTQMSAHMPPQQVVAEIDHCFCAFDQIVGKYQIEKIKTIGDAYMCAGGLPDPEANTPADVVRAALEILDFMNQLNRHKKAAGKEELKIRIGIHTGPVVAGIVGIKKFAYDIWGDTVNTAARMESTGVEGHINISGDTYELIKEKFACTHRGKIVAKHKGEIDMYFVEKERELVT